MTHGSPPLPGPDPSDDLAQQRLRLEIMKLQEETRVLRRPNISLWVTALVGLLGIAIQYVRSNQAYQAAAVQKDKAEIDKAKAELDIARLQVTRGRLDTLLLQTQAALDSLQARRANVEAKLQAAQDALRVAQSQLATLATADQGAHAAVRQAIGRASESVGQLGTALKQTSAAATQTGDSLRVIRSELASTGISPGSPVIATIRIPYRASLSYRRWISRNVVVNAGIVDSGETLLQLPYGGYIYFDAKNLATDRVTLRSADCAHGCFVSFE